MSDCFSFHYRLIKELLMNAHQLRQSLQSVSMQCFVKYFKEFNDSATTSEELAKTLAQVEGYTEKSSRSRVSKARRIIREGHTQDVLQQVIDSKRTEPWVIKGARSLVEFVK